MNKFFSNLLTATAISLAFAAVVSSCKKKFDEPPVEAPVTNLRANTTIAQLKARHTVAGAFDPINDVNDVIIRGIVIGDDRSGNLYKTMVIQDSTGGLAVLVDLNNFYNSYPIGREVFIKCNGLVLSDYANQIQLGGGIATGSAPTLADIPAARINNYIFKGTLGNVITPADVTASQLGTTMQDKYINTLIRLTNYEFAVADTAKTYASAGIASPSAVSYDLFSCSNLSSPGSNSNIQLRTSNYSNFAAAPLPNGNGTITAIYSIFRTFKQLTIRDTNDVKLWGGRCGSGPVAGAGNLLSENFESLSTTGNPPIAITGWTNLAETGGKLYEARTFSGNKYAQITAFGSGQATVNSWLVTRAINLGSFANKRFTFDSKAGFANGAALKVLISTNYTGTGNPWAAGVTWTDVTSQATLSPGLTSGYPNDFTPSGNISLNAYSGTIYIAFKYEGADPSGTASDRSTTWQIDNINVYGN